MRSLWDRRSRLALAVATATLPAAGAAAQYFLDVGKQPQITILINSSPW